MNFGTNILWITLGFVAMALSRSWWHSGAKAIGLVLGAIGAAAIAAGTFL